MDSVQNLLILSFWFSVSVINSKVTTINYKSACWNYHSCILTNIDNLDSFANAIPSNSTGPKRFYQSRLYIRYSNLTRIPSRIDDVFPNVHGLYINYCEVKYLNQYSFEDMQALIEISLKHNDIRDVGDDIFRARKQKNLRDLDLSYNHIQQIHWNAFGGIPSLEILHLNNNRIKEISRNMFRLPELKEIYLNDNIIDRIPIGIFANNQLLKIIHLQRNRIVRFDRFTETNNVNVVEYLDLSNNPIGLAKDLNQNIFWNMAHLEHLNLSTTSLKALANTSLSDLKEVREMDLSNNKLQFLNIYDFRLLRNLKLLYLHNNNFKQFEFDMLGEFGIELHFLSLHNNNWTCPSLYATVQYVEQTHVDIMNWPGDVQTVCDMWKECKSGERD